MENKLHSIEIIDSSSESFYLKRIRVPGGWIYITQEQIIYESGKYEWQITSSVFVPFNNEFLAAKVDS